MVKMACVVAVLLAGCGGGSRPMKADAPAPMDAADDAGPPHDSGPGWDGSYPPSWYTKLGDACEASQTVFCEQGVALCVESVCRQQCHQPDEWVTCPTGESEDHGVLNGVDYCVCLP